LKRNQKTIKKAAEFEGVGLHSGEHVRMRFKPAGPDEGITFIRVDLPKRPRIRLRADSVVQKLRRSALAKDGAEVQTVEHLLASLSAIGISNLEVELDGTEVPGADGSSAPFYELLTKEAGITEQEAELIPFRIEEPITVVEGDTSLVALPCKDDSLTISYVLDYDAPLLRSQYLSLKVTQDSFASEIAPARTFCLASEVEALRQMGLGKGANYENTLVVNGDTILKNTLRFPNEFVRHKILDLIGDLYMLGGPVVGQIIATKSGHLTNMRLVQRIAEDDRRRKAAEGGDSTGLDIRAIQKMLPHRYPMLLVDRVLEIEGTKRAVGIKNVTFNEPFFQGHWPENPIMPGVLLIEAMAQMAGILLCQHVQSRYAVLLSLDKVKLRQAVVPGDQVLLEAVSVKLKARTAQINTTATVDGRLVGQAEIKVMLIDA